MMGQERMRERGDLFPGDNALMAGRKTGVRLIGKCDDIDRPVMMWGRKR